MHRAAVPARARRGLLRPLPAMDLPFLILVLTLVGFGLVMLYSASSAVALYRRGDAFAYLRPQLLYAALGIGAMWVASRVDYHIYHKLAWPLLALSMVLLTAVLFMPEYNGCKRWLVLPGLGTLQPSEIAKFAVVLVFAHIIALNHDRMGSFAPMADRIVASTLACACAAAGGRVELTGCRPETYAPLLEILAQMGCRVETGPESAVVTRLGALHGAGRVFTGVYPALATDAAPLLAAAMLAADSASSIEDVVFERRFGCAEGFAAFGAAVQVQGRTLDIRPVRQLQGACARAADLRGGAALVVAALAARGRSRITDTGYIDRGYAGFAQMLAELGAQIEREMPRESASEKKTPSKKQN